MFFTLIKSIYPVVLALLGFSFLVGFHELGHFLFCKLFGVQTPSFSIGFGPRLFQKKFGDTVFALSAIPFGGYVEIAGMSEPGQGDQKHAHVRGQVSFTSRPYYQKMLIISGGVLFNLIFAFTALTGLLYVGDIKTPLLFPLNATTTLASVEAGAPAELAGLAAGDTIVDVVLPDGQSLKQDPAYFPVDLLRAISQNPHQAVSVLIDNGTTTRTVALTIGQRSEADSRGYIGVAFEDKALEHHTVGASCVLAAKQTAYWATSVLGTLKGLFVRRSLDGVGGPLMIISQMVKGAERGPVVLLAFLAFISVNLAVLNLIPLPVFDGGQALFCTIEALVRRPISESIKGKIYTGTAILIMILMAYISLKDMLVIVQNYLAR